MSGESREELRDLAIDIRKDAADFIEHERYNEYKLLTSYTERLEAVLSRIELSNGYREGQKEALESLKRTLLSMSHQERVRISGLYSEKYAGKDISPEEVAHCNSPVTATLANVIELINIRLRRLPGYEQATDY